MFPFNESESSYLKRLGERLEKRRLAKNERQEAFAARLGISPPTYRKMVSGDPNVKIGYWIQALNLMGALKDIDQLLPEKQSFFAAHDQQQSPRKKRAVRKRVRRKS